MADGPPAYKGAKSAGKVIVGITTFVMVVILVSGIVIWIPRTRKALRTVLSYRVRKVGGVLVRQSCLAGHICYPVFAGHGSDRAYMVVPMVPHGSLWTVRCIDSPSRHVRPAAAK